MTTEQQQLANATKQVFVLWTSADQGPGQWAEMVSDDEVEACLAELCGKGGEIVAQHEVAYSHTVPNAAGDYLIYSAADGALHVGAQDVGDGGLMYWDEDLSVVNAACAEAANA
jgi:hypothetical protein